MFHTKLCDLLGIKYPVIQGALGGVSGGPRLAAAVSNAGAFGVLASFGLTNNQLREEISQTRALTDKPFGLNIYAAKPAFVSRVVKLAVEEGVMIVTWGRGYPGQPIVSLLKGHGITVLPVVAAVRHAVREGAQWNWPLNGCSAGISECLIVFDDVFVPWNRVFMCGEWQFSRDIAWTFSVFHRLFGTAHKVISLEQTVGAVALMAKFNGLDKYPHIQEKLAWLAMHCQINDTMARAACEHPDMYEDIGLAAPNLMYTNIAKFMFANGQHEASKLLADITGGVTTTVFGYKDWMNPEERPFNDKYRAGKGGIPTNTGFTP